MRYAIISDIHGNFPALKAVLLDSKKRSIDKYIFLGDYWGECPFPNECIDLIKSIDNSHFVYGNKEEIINDDIKVKSLLFYDQYIPLCWNYKTLTNENKVFLKNLSEKITINTKNNNKIFISHSPIQHFENTILSQIGGKNYSLMMDKGYFSHEEYLLHIEEQLFCDKSFKLKMDSFENGIYVFGHHHTQWYAHFGNKLFINPGSCGQPFDFDTHSPYTILTESDDSFDVEEIRVPYDLCDLMKNIELSPISKKSKFWNDLFLAQISRAECKIVFFLDFAQKIAKKLKDTNKPYSNSTWKNATLLWNF